MTTLKSAPATGLLVLILVLAPGCKKSPTTTTIAPLRQTIDLLCEPVSGASGTIITVTILIAGNSKEMRVFGLDMSFDIKMFQFQEVRSGNLTGSWAAVDGNEVTPGNLKVGGFQGAGTAIPVASQGTLASIRFKVTGNEYGNGQQSDICVQQYTDDLSGFTPGSACARFTLQK